MRGDLAALSVQFMEAVRDRNLMTDVWVERDGRPQLVARHVSPLMDGK